ncbi:putative solute carrier family 26 member 10-like [Scophthalmus maximus]|uniref:Putative solute carrier family 26 member 10-like n=1 Tax=Scophthalmus maximus TaxID=52904 RepID=A0A2U9BZG8_SCOMX|nr:putative solute carrier family 26 member 10-like [Scophthalmus maximus]
MDGDEQRAERDGRDNPRSTDSTITHLRRGDTMSASVAVYRSLYTEDRFKQAYGSEDGATGSRRLRDKLAGRCRCSKRACLHLLRDRVPIVQWLPRYRLRKWILGDTVAGLTVGILHIPQGEWTL